MRRLVVVLVFLLGFLGPANAESRHDFAEARQDNGVFFVGSDTAAYTGILCSQYDDGKRRQEFRLQDGHFVGVGKTWYPDGTVMDETTFNDKGQMEGLALGYYPSGKLKAKVEYVGGKINGLNQLFWETGDAKTVGPMKDGLWHGEVKTWWPNQGMKALVTYQEGKQHGPCKEWHENGQMSFEGCFVNDEPVGEIKTWHENGKQASIVVFGKDKLESEMYWDAKGNVDYSRQCNSIMKVIAAALDLAAMDGEVGSASGSVSMTVPALVQKGYLKMPPSCPGSGTYSITSGVVSCSAHGVGRQ